MTSAVYRNTPVLSVPLSQNTAPVFEHNCLYTHDIKRKQKRWQDGLLRYHTFNQRVMVFDPAGNKVGDTHWNSNVSLQEGDEVTMEKWGVLVEVSERVRQTATDLSEIRGPQRRTSPLRPAPIPLQSPAPGVTYRSVSQPKHKSLNALLSSSRNTPCRAPPPVRSTNTAPRGGVQTHAFTDAPPAKRIRLDTPLVQKAQRDSGIQARDSSRVVARHDISTRRTEPRERPSTLTAKKLPEIIDLCEDPLDDFQGFSSDIFLPSPVRPPPGEQVGLRKTGPGAQSPRVPNPRVVPENHIAPRRRSPPAQRDPVARRPAVNDIENHTPAHCDRGLRDGQPRPSSLDPAAKKLQTVTLKVAPSVPRRKKGLLCQNLLLPKPSSNGDRASQRPSAAPVRQPVRMWTGSPEPLSESEPEPTDFGGYAVLEDRVDLHGDNDDSVPCVTKNHVDDVATPRTRNTSPKLLPRVAPAEIKKAAAASARKKSPTERRPATVAPRSMKGAAEPRVSADTAGQAAEPPNVDLLLEAPPIGLPNVTEPRSKNARVSPNEVAKKTPPPAVPAAGAAQKDLGPWSREAFDLFLWRPPGWNEEKWRVEA